ncbi:glycosyltransferase [Gammaproteobacteria bacterium]|nr:glycosyltransferase [Gammaproteobacteria bacterium]
MKISVLLPTLWIGGAEKLHACLINRWLELGHDIDLIVLFENDHDIDIKPLIDDGCKIFHLHNRSYRYSITSLYKFFKNNQYDFIVAPMWPLTIVASISWMLSGRRGKLFLSEHTNITVSSDKEVKTPLWLIKLSMKIFYKSVDGIIAVSEGVKQDILSLTGFTSNDVRVIYNPTALGIKKLDSLEKSKYIEALWDTRYEYRVLGAGGIKAAKNFSMLISAFSKLQPSVLARSQLIILGDGPLKEDLNKQIQDLGLEDQIKLPGRVLDPYPWFQSASLFTLSSSWEGFGNVLVEALESEVPIVSTDCFSGPAEILEEGAHGMLVPVADEDAFATAMEQSLTTIPDTSRHLQRANDFSVPKISDEYLEYFNSSKITIILPTLRMGGAEKLHVNLINQWIKEGNSVDLVILFDVDDGEDLVPFLNTKCNIKHFHHQSYRYSITSLYKFFKNNQYDFIVAPMWPLTIVASISWMLSGRRGKLFLSEHTNITVSSDKEVKTPLWLIKLSMKIFYKSVDGIIAVSEGVKQDILSLTGFTSNDVRVIYNPTALGIKKLDSLEKSKYIEALWDTRYEYRVLGAGGIKAAKNFSMLISAFSKLQPSVLARSQLIILGDGPLKEDLNKQIQDLGLEDQIKLPGRVLDPYPWFQSASLFTLSSSWEGFGNVLVEALESEVPIVSTDCFSGPAEILEEGAHGMLVPVADEDAFATAMEQSLTTIPDTSRHLQRANDFSVPKISDEYLEYFLE